MLKELKREPNKLRYVMAKDNNDLYFVYYEKLQGESPKSYLYLPFTNYLKSERLNSKRFKTLTRFYRL